MTHLHRRDLSALVQSTEPVACPVEGCPGPDVDHTGTAAVGCGLERDSEECEA